MAGAAFILVNNNLTYNPLEANLCTDKDIVCYELVPAPVPVPTPTALPMPLGVGGGGKSYHLRYDPTCIPDEVEKAIYDVAKSLWSNDGKKKKDKRLCLTDPLTVERLKREAKKDKKDKEIWFLREKLSEAEKESKKARKKNHKEMLRLKRLIRALQSKIKRLIRKRKDRVEKKTLEEVLTEEVKLLKEDTPLTFPAEVANEVLTVPSGFGDIESPSLWRAIKNALPYAISSVGAALATYYLVPDHKKPLKFVGYSVSTILAGMAIGRAVKTMDVPGQVRKAPGASGGRIRRPETVTLMAEWP